MWCWPERMIRQGSIVGCLLCYDVWMDAAIVSGWMLGWPIEKYQVRLFRWLMFAGEFDTRQTSGEKYEQSHQQND